MKIRTRYGVFCISVLIVGIICIYFNFSWGLGLLIISLLILFMTWLRYWDESRNEKFNGILDSSILLVIAIFGFYGGFLLSARDSDLDRNRHIASVIKSTNERILFRVQYIQEIHDSSVISDTTALEKFKTADEQVPYYVLDQLPVDNVLVYFSERTFNFLYAAESTEKALYNNVLNDTLSIVFRTYCLQTMVRVLREKEDQLMTEAEYLNGDFGYDSLAAITHKRIDRFNREKIDLSNHSQ